MTKTIICADAIKWMAETTERGAIVTSLPDADEVKMTPAQWEGWFQKGIDLALSLAGDAPAIFYQTDRKTGGRVVSKAALLLAVVQRRSFRIMWHKIVLRHGVGTKDLYRPGYTHLIAVSRKGTCGAPTPDVIERGKMIYPNAMGLNAARLAVEFAGRSSKTIIDPFCGRGTVPAVAEALGFDAIGVDIDSSQCALAERLKMELK